MNVCGDYHFLEGVRIAMYIITILKIVIPILLIGFGSYDFIQTVLDPDKHTVQNQAISFVKRIASAVIIFLLPTIISLVFSLLSNSSGKITELQDCLKNANSGYINTLKMTAKEYQKSQEVKDTSYSSGYNSSNYNVPFTPSNNQNNSNGTSSNSGSSVTASGDFLKTAESTWTNVYNNFTTYGGSWNIPPTGKTIDCSAFVSWVLYEYGYKDEFNHQHITQQFVTTNWNEKYGWEEIPVAAGEDVTSKLQPGDILVRDNGDNDGHMNITAANNGGTILAYDCGASSNWKNSGGGAVDKTKFAKSDRRAGKIIRVTPSTNTNSSSNSTT